MDSDPVGGMPELATLPRPESAKWSRIIKVIGVNYWGRSNVFMTPEMPLRPPFITERPHGPGRDNLTSDTFNARRNRL